MKQLNLNWITEGLMDFEYKKYLLLAYLQEVSRDFDEKKLYPVLSDLVLHYNNLITIKRNKTYVSNQFPKQISKIDLEIFKVEFEKLIADEEYMEDVEAIIDYAIPAMHRQLEDGKEIYQEVEDDLKIFPVGIVSLNPEEGYMMLTKSSSKETSVYSYMITIFENANEKFRGIKTEFIGNYSRSFSHTFEEIKFQLIKEFKNISNPATYVIESKYEYPLNETLLPVAKRSLVRYIYQSAA
ncbi:MAG: hypothetical protein H0V65_00990 [Chitinophagales bacterium]|jgi:hypothetical protein|nr:hypothetical protein [Chitinophagales bacterium]